MTFVSVTICPHPCLPHLQVSMTYETDAVIIAAGLTTVIVFALTIFAFQVNVIFCITISLIIITSCIVVTVTIMVKEAIQLKSCSGQSVYCFG